jgi:NAD+ kinase
MITIFYNRKPSIRKKAEAIIAEIKNAGYSCILDKNKKHTTLILALGGDGTFVRAAYQTRKTNIPILTVRLGRLGFLAELNGDQVLTGIKKFHENKFIIDERNLLSIAIFKNNKKIHEDVVLNDAVICRQGIARLFEINIESKNNKTTFRADGLIISTATGSTAYNLAAGGPIIDPRRPLYLLTPICPHQLHWESLQIPLGQTTTITATATKNIPIMLTYDGSRIHPLPIESVVKVTDSLATARFVRFRKYNFKKVFREKFNS